ncbi:coiled-coil domain-containing protein 91-like [Asterias rubens]|uniref:coiled-coil domain-containing protein 91-like n=1 Tax=Asterias rubens TaxID=7604 RepID=UPI00145504FE|nr:coiled-coil domain-containing protein 91-like [Asterias rubens]
MADNWANFPNAAAEAAAAAAAQAQVQGAAGGEIDDDWGDFGGFEEAAPPPPELGHQVPGPGVEASPSPWASFAIASVQNPAAGQPDLLMAQTQPPLQPQIDPPFADPVPQMVAAAPPELTSQAEASRQQAQAQQAVAPLQNQSINNNLDDVDVNLHDGLAGVEGAVGPLPVENHNAASSAEGDRFQDPADSPAGQRLVQRSSSSVEVFAAEMTGKVGRLEDRLSAADREKSRLQRIRDELTQKLEALEQEVEGHRQETAEQKQRYEQVQARHALEMDEIRKAGHDALAIIVEEYKELCKCAVLQQQEASEKQLQVAITKETERCQEILKSQHDRLANVLDEERQKNEDRLKEALQEQLETQKTMLQTCLREEQDKNKSELKKATEEMQTTNQEALQRALEEERSKGKEMLEIQRSEAARSLEEEQKCHRETLQTELERERQNSKVAIKNALEEERKRHLEAIEEASVNSRKAMEEYNAEQKRLDSVSRHRSFASLDLFLESARQQLKSLMDDKPVEMPKSSS